MCDTTGLAEVMLGLDGFQVTDVVEINDGAELVVKVETTATVAGCLRCGTRALPHERRAVTYRDLECFGRPTQLEWNKRRWRCPDPDCGAKTWTEQHDGFASRVLLTRRAGVAATIEVGKQCRPVAELARRFAVAWETIMDAVVEYGTALVNDPGRVGRCRRLCVDETSFQAAKPVRATQFVTGLIDADRRAMIDLIEGRNATDLGAWLDRQGVGWCQSVRVVATDLAGSYRRGMAGRLDHSVKVADPFHVVRAAQRCLTRVRTRVQREQTGHRGRKHDPLYRSRKVLDTGSERLNGDGVARLLEGLRLGDPHDEVLGAWLAKEHVRDLYLTDNINLATVILGRTIRACKADEVPEIQSLGRTLSKWWTEILNHHRTGASNGIAEAINLLVKAVKRAGRGFHRFDHYRLRVLLYTGGCDWSKLATTTTPIRTRQTLLK